MDLPDPVDLLGIDWCRRWVTFRSAVVIALALAAPHTLALGLQWYAKHETAAISHRLLPVLTTPPHVSGVLRRTPAAAGKG